MNGKYKGQEPVEIQAFMKEDVQGAVPADIVVIFPGDKAPVLLLFEGEVIVQAKNNDGEVLNEYFTSVVKRTTKNPILSDGHGLVVSSRTNASKMQDVLLIVSFLKYSAFLTNNIPYLHH